MKSRFRAVLIFATFLITGLLNSTSITAQTSKPELPVVWVLSTGGTITGQGSSSTDLSNYKPGSILGEDLVKAVPEIKRVADVRVEQIASTALSPDGPLNLLNAIRTAATREARGKGALVVMNEEINDARDVTKTNTYKVETFRAPELDYLGYIDEDKITFYRASTKRHTVNSEFDVSGLSTLPKVDIVYSYIEPNPEVIRALVSSGDKGLVFAGTGAGNISKFETEPLQKVLSIPAASRPVLVRSSRAGNGRVTARDEYDKMGMIQADNLNAQKARILLMLALTLTNDPDRIKRIFSEY